MLTQAMVGLIGHVLGHTPAGGAIRVAAGSAEGDGMARLQVTGEGVPTNPAALARLFTVWGGDLGLTLSRRIVERHDGRIWAAAAPEGAGMICVDLPVGAARS
jgi:signal transduction histidine kinase